MSVTGPTSACLLSPSRDENDMHIYTEIDKWIDREIKLGRAVGGKVRHNISQCYAVNKKQGGAKQLKNTMTQYETFYFWLH